MVENQNPEIINRISEEIKESNLNILPKAIANKIQAVLIVNPKVRTIFRAADLTGTGSATIFTTPADKDFYLTSAELTFVCDSAADTTFYRILITPDQQGAANCIIMRKLTLTAEARNVTKSFPTPIKLARNSTITVATTLTVGASTVTGIIAGHEVDTLEK